MADELIEAARHGLQRATQITAQLPPDSAEPFSEAILDLTHSVDSLISRCLETERHLAAQQCLLDDRLLRIEKGALFSTWNRLTSLPHRLYSKSARLLPAYFAERQQQRQRKRDQAEYSWWVSQEQSLLPSREAVRTAVSRWARQPLISIAVAASNAESLESTIEALDQQLYGTWELCAAGPASVGKSIDRLSKCRPARSVRYLELQAQISEPEALNTAASHASGQYVMFVSPGDRLSPHAFYFIAEALQRCDFDLIYSDEDAIDSSGRRFRPVFKPGWSPYLLKSTMYVGRSLAVNRARFEALGGFRSEAGGAHFHEFLLRLSKSSNRVRHIGRVLYHASNVATSVPAAVSSAEFPARKESDPTELTIIICSRSPELISRCLRELRRTTGPQAQRVIVVAHEERGVNKALRKAIQDRGAEVLPFIHPFDFSSMNNAAAELVQTPAILFLNDDVIATKFGWTEALGTHLQASRVGIVGATLRYPSGDLQHAGLAVGMNDGIGHPGRHMTTSDLWPWLLKPREVSAVTGACLAIHTHVFRQIGGFDPAFPNNYNDVDLCLRVREMGLEILTIPIPGLIHAEGSTRQSGVRFEERYRFYEKWAGVLRSDDPYYSRSLSLTDQIRLQSGSEPGYLSMLTGAHSFKHE